MDFKNNLALKKKRELLGSLNKRKRSLRKYIDSLKQDECRLDITQVTKCVFLGALCLKPVPQLFDSPLLLEELDMKVGAVRQTISKNVNVGELVQTVMKNQASSVDVANKDNTEKECLNVPKINKKSLKEKRELENISSKIEIQEHKFVSGYQCLSFEDNTAASPEEPIYTDLAVLAESPLMVLPDSIIAPTTFGANNENSTTNTNDSLISKSYDDNFIEKLSAENHSITGEDVINEENLDNSLADINYETNSMSPSQYEDNSNLKREATPELILSDSDEDAIDQLMFNIMDIKVGPLSFEKDFFEMSPPDIKHYQEYRNEFETTPQSPQRDKYTRVHKQDKKLPKRTPQCKICSQVFPNYVQLKKHGAAHDGEKPYICAKCNESHRSLDQLLAHLRIHQGKRPYVCKKCNKGFKSLKSLENHKPVHVLRKVTCPKKVFKCEICGKEFRKLCDLERHTRVHTGEKPSVCNICNRRFQQAHNLNKHLLIHTKEKPFQCDICHKKFGRNDVLNRHLLTHSVKKPIRCENCMKSFIRASQLLAHRVKCQKGEF